MTIATGCGPASSGSRNSPNWKAPVPYAIRASAGGGGISKMSRDINSSSSPGKEIAEQGSALGLTNQANDFDPMVQAWIGKDIVNGSGRTSLSIRSAEHQPGYPRMNHGSGAHHARFDCRV